MILEDYVRSLVLKHETRTAQRRERQEREHRDRYPEAITYGRHAAGTLCDAHYLTFGREYVGRHRHPQEGW